MNFILFSIILSALGVIGVILVIISLIYTYFEDKNFYDLDEIPTWLLYDYLKNRYGSFPRSVIKAELKRRKKNGRLKGFC